MIKDLESVLVVVRDLPENYQKEAAQSLAWFLKRVEEEMTMTKEEIEELRRLDRERTRELCRQIRELLGKKR